ncbi:MAG: DNA adenine methylase [Bacillota bacterium]
MKDAETLKAPVRPKPFLKWAGGKGQLLWQLEKYFPDTFKGYHEPFLGAGAVFFHLNPGEAYLSDQNEELINAFLVVRDHLEELVRLLRLHKNNPEYYYFMRGLDSTSLGPVERASRFIYLNKTCFNGLYRVNKKGRFNVPFGRYKNPRYADVDVLAAARSALINTRAIDVADFGIVLGRAAPGDFVYFDPPYQPISETSRFTSYTPGSFDACQQERLARVFGDLDTRGCRVLLSNSASEFIRDLYRGFRVETVKAKRYINCDKNRRSDIDELVVMNYD